MTSCCRSKAIILAEIFVVIVTRSGIIYIVSLTHIMSSRMTTTCTVNGQIVGIEHEP